jgi:hypothetical protein
MEDWFLDGAVVIPEVEGRDRSVHDQLAALYRELDPSPER